MLENNSIFSRNVLSESTECSVEVIELFSIRDSYPGSRSDTDGGLAPHC